MKKALLILTLMLMGHGLTYGQIRMATPRNTYYERTGDTPEAFAQRRMAAAQSGPNRVVGTRSIFPRVLVIMVNFSDYAFVSTKADVDSMFNAQNWTKDGATGSIRQYFYDQSSGAYNPQFDVVGPVTLSQGYAHYGSNNTQAAAMVLEACRLVNDSVDFSQYDTNNDGKVDMVFVSFAGFGENDPPTNDLVSNPANLVWPHYWTISSAGHGSDPRIFDGKTIENYECANELDGLFSTATRKVVAGIGVMVHEFCHGLGLPDLYITGGNQFAHKTWGKWSVMDYGPYNNDMHTPPSLSAYERYFMGWITPTLLNSADDITLEPLSTSNQAGIITSDGQMPGTGRGTIYWMVENRQKTGWDIDIPGSGLLLSQIKPWSSNSVNNDKNNMKIDILEADGITAVNGTHNDPVWYGKQGDVYPYGTLDSIVVAPNYPINEITQNTDRTVSFKVCGGKQTPTEVSAECMVQRAKCIVNGRMVIVRGDVKYDVLGRALR